MDTINEKINELLEFLYEVDNAKKIEGTKKIMALSKNPENLAVMAENGQFFLIFLQISQKSILKSEKKQQEPFLVLFQE